MEWTRDLSVGVNEIDEQHKELFRRIGSLVDAIRKASCKDTIDEVISFLEEYSVTHFAHEEGYMALYGYPGYAAHKQQHAIFLTSLADLKALAAAPRVKGASYDLSVTTNQVVVDWIRSHIIVVDIKLGEFLRARLP